MANRSRRPYQLPKPLYCDPDAPVTMELVKKYIERHEQRLPRYAYLENMYEGFHDVFNGPEKESWKPDNRLAVNYPRKLTEDFLGYGYGIPIRKTHPDEKVQDAINSFETTNNIEDHEYELGKMCCKYGHAWEYFYQDEDAQTRVTRFSPKELFVVYDDSIRHRALFAVRYSYHEREDGSKGEMYGEVMTPVYIAHFDAGKLQSETDADLNPYGMIPVVEWMLNDEHIGLYEHVAGMNETYSHTIGEKANDVDAFAEAYMAILGAEVDEDGVRRIRDDRIINIFGTDNAKDILVQFLQKPTADGTQENLLDRLDNLIHKISMIVDIDDDIFSSAISGVALFFKLQPMNNLARTFDRKITKSLRKRYKIFCSLQTNVTNKDAWKEITITMHRNIPNNVSEEADNAGKLTGIVSRRTQLSVMPSIVPDPDAEIERMEKGEEEAAAASIADRMFDDDTDEVTADGKDEQ